MFHRFGLEIFSHFIGKNRKLYICDAGECLEGYKHVLLKADNDNSSICWFICYEFNSIMNIFLHSVFHSEHH